MGPVEENGDFDYSIVDIIKKKRDLEPLERGEIDYFIDGAVTKYITEAQIGETIWLSHSRLSIDYYWS